MHDCKSQLEADRLSLLSKLIIEQMKPSFHALYTKPDIKITTYSRVLDFIHVKCRSAVKTDAFGAVLEAGIVKHPQMKYAASNEALHKACPAKQQGVHIVTGLSFHILRCMST